MRDEELVSFLQWALPIPRLRWRGFLNVRRQVGKRLNRRLAELGLPTLDDYRERLRADPTEWAVLDSFFRVTISRLYRDRRVFDILRFRVLPELARAAHSPGRTIRCWCAGCACGEEVYTVELIWELDARRNAPEASLELIGADADLEVLYRAERGCYPSSSLESLPKDWRMLAFSRDDGEYCIRREFRGAIAFRL